MIKCCNNIERHLLIQVYTHLYDTPFQPLQDYMILKLQFKLCRNCDGATNNQTKNLREWESERDLRHKALPYSIHNDFTNPKSNPFYVLDALPNALVMIAIPFFISCTPVHV